MKIIKITLSLLLSAVMTVLLMIPALAVDAESDVITDLTGATVNGQAFDFGVYPADSDGSASVISLIETGYSSGGDYSAYALYVYVYNPSQRTVISNSGKNMIQLAVAWDENGIATDFEKFSLEMVDISSGNYPNRFIKFKVVDRVSELDGFRISQRVNKTARKYTVSGIELHFAGYSNATEYKDGHEYTFTGFGTNIVASVKDILVLSLDVSDTYWRSASSSAGAGHQNQINSVYFSVPNSVLDTYGYLTKIKASWNEQKLNPIVVTESQTLYSALSPWVGVDIGGRSNSSVPNGFGAVNNQNVNVAVTTCDCFYVYNVPSVFLSWAGFNAVSTDRIIRTLPGIFKTGTITAGAVDVSSDTLKTYIRSKNCASWLFSDAADSGRLKGEQVQTVSIGDELQLSNYLSNHNWWQKFWDYGFKKVELGEEYKSKAPIYTVTSSDVSASLSDSVISDNLYIASEDISDVRAAYSAAQVNDEQLMLFRFAVTDYFSTVLIPKSSVSDGITYGFEETVFLDFDIIELTFAKAGVYTVIPVAASPIDIIGTGTPPNTIAEKADFGWLKILLSVVILVVGVIVLFPLVRKGIDALSELSGGIIDGIAGGGKKRK